MEEASLPAELELVTPKCIPSVPKNDWSTRMWAPSRHKCPDVWSGYGAVSRRMVRSAAHQAGCSRMARTNAGRPVSNAARSSGVIAATHRS